MDRKDKSQFYDWKLKDIQKKNFTAGHDND